MKLEIEVVSPKDDPRVFYMKDGDTLSCSNKDAEDNPFLDLVFYDVRRGFFRRPRLLAIINPQKTTLQVKK